MTRTAIVVRRSTTLVAVILIVALGFLASRVAAAWTASAAPLEVAPISLRQSGPSSTPTARIRRSCRRSSVV